MYKSSKPILPEERELWSELWKIF